MGMNKAFITYENPENAYSNLLAGLRPTFDRFRARNSLADASLTPSLFTSIDRPPSSARSARNAALGGRETLVRSRVIRARRFAAIREHGAPEALATDHADEGAAPFDRATSG